MNKAIRFAGTCPTCGRHLHIPIELYGKLVRCHGCNAEFRASGDRQSNPGPMISSISENKQAVQRGSLDFRVDALLAAADRQLDQPCLHAHR